MISRHKQFHGWYKPVGQTRSFLRQFPQLPQLQPQQQQTQQQQQQQQQQVRWMETETETIQKNKRVRKKPMKLVPTLRDRLRSRSVTSCGPFHKNNELRVDHALMAERMTTRVEWFRGALTTIWKSATSSATLQEGTTSTPAAASTNATANGQVQPIPRPQRQDLKMDFNWWFWNLLLASTPALIVAMYCELVAQPRMANQKAMEQQQKQQPQQQNLQPSTSGQAEQPANTVNPNSTIPPSGPSFTDSWKYLFQWLSGQEPSNTDIPATATTGTANAHMSKTNAASTSSSTTTLEEQLQQLKRQLQQLEAQMANNQDSSPATLTLESSNHLPHHQQQQQQQPSPALSQMPMSPIQQRRLQQQQQQQHDGSTVTPAVPSDTNTDATSIPPSIMSSLSIMWGVLQSVAKGAYQHLPPIPLPQQPPPSKDTTQQHVESTHTQNDETIQSPNVNSKAPILQDGSSLPTAQTASSQEVTQQADDNTESDVYSKRTPWWKIW